MEREDSGTNFWALTSSQLAAQIALIANGDLTAIDAATHAEAGLLVAEWHDALKLPRATFQNEAIRVSQLAGLKKRTIEVLIKTSQNT
jgi:hypothetical protein